MPVFALGKRHHYGSGHSPAREIVELLVTEQHLDDADILLLLEQVCGEAVAERVHRNALVGGLSRNPLIDVDFLKASPGQPSVPKRCQN